MRARLSFNAGTTAGFGTIGYGMMSARSFAIAGTPSSAVGIYEILNSMYTLHEPPLRSQSYDHAWLTCFKRQVLSEVRPRIDAEIRKLVEEPKICLADHRVEVRQELTLWDLRQHGLSGASYEYLGLTFQDLVALDVISRESADLFITGSGLFALQPGRTTNALLAIVKHFPEKDARDLAVVTNFLSAVKLSPNLAQTASTQQLLASVREPLGQALLRAATDTSGQWDHLWDPSFAQAVDLKAAQLFEVISFEAGFLIQKALETRGL